jgi:MFS transporter, DHA1 family, inner membrane transport protein
MTALATPEPAAASPVGRLASVRPESTAAVTLRRQRRTVLRTALVAYLAGNVLAMTAASFEALVLARVVTGALHGLFIGAAFALATSLVPTERMGRAISAVFGVIAVSAAVGVPLGTLVGQSLGWQATFAGVAILGALALAAVLAAVPGGDPRPTGDLGGQARHALAPRVLAVLGVGFLLLGGQFAGLTYLAEFLAGSTGVSDRLVSAFLLSFGVANAVGTMLGGRAADRDASRTLLVANAILAVTLAALAAAGSSPALAVVALAVWGLVGFGLVPSLQHRVVTLAGPGAELAAALPASAVTAGIAIGALAGGAVLDAGPAAPMTLAAVVVATTLPATWATSRLRTPLAANTGADR